MGPREPGSAHIGSPSGTRTRLEPLRRPAEVEDDAGDDRGVSRGIRRDGTRAPKSIGRSAFYTMAVVAAERDRLRSTTAGEDVDRATGDGGFTAVAAAAPGVRQARSSSTEKKGGRTRRRQLVVDASSPVASSMPSARTRRRRTSSELRLMIGAANGEYEEYGDSEMQMPPPYRSVEMR
ncbi:hypothetical protein BD414DRAFT_496712 [Trametes punicea]|nr:hypothetical protein BD414DRAFT_496712 [Trametes punicea]